jgi:predicted DNA-binding transcriptional regulator AlpA
LNRFVSCAHAPADLFLIPIGAILMGASIVTKNIPDTESPAPPAAQREFAEKAMALKAAAEPAFRRQFNNHRSGAKARGIPFLLTYEEWLAIWQASGHIKERGPYKGQYVMARFDDRGPYAADNVKIITNSENAAERSDLRPPGVQVQAARAQVAASLPVFRDLQLLPRQEVMSLVHLSYPTIWQRMRENKFPHSRAVGGKAMWLASEIDAWVSALPVKTLKPLDDEVA